MDFLNKLLHRTSPSGGGGSLAKSPPKSPSTKASEKLPKNTSDSSFLNKGEKDVVSSFNSPKAGPRTEDTKSQDVLNSQNAQARLEEEEDTFEDASENKLNITLLAEDLNKIHLTTPGKIKPRPDGFTGFCNYEDSPMSVSFNMSKENLEYSPNTTTDTHNISDLSVEYISTEYQTNYTRNLTINDRNSSGSSVVYVGTEPKTVEEVEVVEVDSEVSIKLDGNLGKECKSVAETKSIPSANAVTSTVKIEAVSENETYSLPEEIFNLAQNKDEPNNLNDVSSSDEILKIQCTDSAIEYFVKDPNASLDSKFTSPDHVPEITEPFEPSGDTSVTKIISHVEDLQHPNEISSNFEEIEAALVVTTSNISSQTVCVDVHPSNNSDNILEASEISVNLSEIDMETDLNVANDSEINQQTNKGKSETLAVHIEQNVNEPQLLSEINKNESNYGKIKEEDSIIVINNDTTMITNQIVSEANAIVTESSVTYCESSGKAVCELDDKLNDTNVVSAEISEPETVIVSSERDVTAMKCSNIKDNLHFKTLKECAKEPEVASEESKQNPMNENNSQNTAMITDNIIMTKAIAEVGHENVVIERKHSVDDITTDSVAKVMVIEESDNVNCSSYNTHNIESNNVSQSYLDNEMSVNLPEIDMETGLNVENGSEVNQQTNKEESETLTFQPQFLSEINKNEPNYCQIKGEDSIIVINNDTTIITNQNVSEANIIVTESSVTFCESSGKAVSELDDKLNNTNVNPEEISEPKTVITNQNVSEANIIVTESNGTYCESSGKAVSELDDKLNNTNVVPEEISEPNNVIVSSERDVTAMKCSNIKDSLHFKTLEECAKEPEVAFEESEQKPINENNSQNIALISNDIITTKEIADVGHENVVIERNNFVDDITTDSVAKVMVIEESDNVNCPSNNNHNIGSNNDSQSYLDSENFRNASEVTVISSMKNFILEESIGNSKCNMSINSHEEITIEDLSPEDIADSMESEPITTSKDQNTNTLMNENNPITTDSSLISSPDIKNTNEDVNNSLETVEDVTFKKEIQSQDPPNESNVKENDDVSKRNQKFTLLDDKVCNFLDRLDKTHSEKKQTSTNYQIDTVGKVYSQTSIDSTKKVDTTDSKCTSTQENFSVLSASCDPQVDNNTNNVSNQELSVKSKRDALELQLNENNVHDSSSENLQRLSNSALVSDYADVLECDTFDNVEESTFDERLAEEAANVSKHILNVSRELEESDSDEDHNKTVITVGNGGYIMKNTGKTPPSKPVTPHSPPSNSPTFRSITNDFESQFDVPESAMKSYMESMRAVLPAHLNQSEAGPITADELSTQDLGFQDGANLDLDFFSQFGNNEGIIKTSLTRDSLYVKFDPIVGALVSKAISDKFTMPPPPTPAHDKKEENSPVQPEAVVTEAEDGGAADVQKTPIRNPALETVQKLISLTPPTNPATPAPPAAKAAAKVQHQAEMERRDSDLAAVQARCAELEAELKIVKEREQRLKKEVANKDKSKQQLSLVMEEYEKTISQLVAQKEEDRKTFEVEKELILKERETAMQHLNNMEIAFNDVHQKYERSKTIIEGMKANEEILKRSLAEFDEAVKSSTSKYETLKNHAVKQLEQANAELDTIQRGHQVEIAKLKAMQKKSDIRIKSLEEALEQKTKENAELAAICDELINKVGGN